MAQFNLNSVISGSAQNSLTNNNPLTAAQQNQFSAGGLPSSSNSTGAGLPFEQIQSEIPGVIKRSNITWFVPQFGIVRMYINPQSISYVDKKLITKERTKGGFTLQYWGEELTQLNIQGTTGSSGVEGINALQEIYRAEQYSFDAVGLTLAGNNATADVANNLVQGIGGAIGGSIGGTNGSSGAGGLLGGILGLDSPNNLLSARNIPSLAQLAFTVEMYYNGWVYRGYFENMTVTERADNFLWDYQITFMATQRKGYRTNQFPFQKSATGGPSQYNTPNSFNGQVFNPQTGQ
jgi:hypothetical protein